MNEEKTQLTAKMDLQNKQLIESKSKNEIDKL